MLFRPTRTVTHVLIIKCHPQLTLDHGGETASRLALVVGCYRGIRLRRITGLRLRIRPGIRRGRRRGCRRGCRRSLRRGFRFRYQLRYCRGGRVRYRLRFRFRCHRGCCPAMSAAIRSWLTRAPLSLELPRADPVSYTHLRGPRDRTRSRMPSSA